MIGERFEVVDATAFPDFPEIEETGTTFLENARLKAEGISHRVEGWVLSDDSGLEVDALGGAPGVWSSSFGGEEGNHAKNNARLLAEMAGKAARGARFRCTMVLARGGWNRPISTALSRAISWNLSTAHADLATIRCLSRRDTTRPLPSWAMRLKTP